MNDLAEIKTEVERLTAIIGAAGNSSLPTYGHTEDFARPHIEVDSRGYHFVVVERGEELDRFTTYNLDDLCYRIFRNVTFNLAINYELTHRVGMQDFRRISFQRQVALLSQLSAWWAEREKEDHQRILREHPFDDYSGIRAAFTKELRDAGNSPQTAWQVACERYPLPVKLR